MTEMLEAAGVVVRVARSQRKTTELRVERDGTVVVAAPQSTSIEAIRALVADRIVWIHEKLALKALVAVHKPREFVTGEGFEYLGRSYRLRFVDAIEGAEGLEPLRLSGDYFELLRREAERAREHFVRWYQGQAAHHLTERVATLAYRTGTRPRAIRIQDLGHKWGSCSRTGTLYFNWKVIMAPRDIVDYVAVHELVHLASGGHKEAFWHGVGRVLPDFEQRRSWLTLNGPRLEL